MGSFYVFDTLAFVLSHDHTLVNAVRRKHSTTEDYYSPKSTRHSPEREEYDGPRRTVRRPAWHWIDLGETSDGAVVVTESTVTGDAWDRSPPPPNLMCEVYA